MLDAVGATALELTSHGAEGVDCTDEGVADVVVLMHGCDEDSALLDDVGDRGASLLGGVGAPVVVTAEDVVESELGVGGRELVALGFCPELGTAAALLDVGGVARRACAVLSTGADSSPKRRQPRTPSLFGAEQVSPDTPTSPA